jgi:hypothetical protein
MRIGLPSGVSAFGARLNGIGFERTRRALAALPLAMFVTLYLLLALNRPEGLVPALLALAACYGVAFGAVVAEWFWGRWFATGLGLSGIMVAVAIMAQLGWTPAIAIYGGLHAMVVVALMGDKMAVRYDLQEAWRKRYGMDDLGVARLRKTVTRAAASLPSLILWALAPREGNGMMTAIAAFSAAALGVAGVRGLVRLRSWGVLALGAAGVLVAAFGHVTSFASAPAVANVVDFVGPTLAGLFLAAAVLPFAGPVLRFVTRRR